MSARQYSDLAIFRKLLQEARPYWVHILAIFLLDLLATPLALLSPLPLKVVVDNAIGSEPLPDMFAALLPVAVDHSGTVLLIFAAVALIVIALLSQFQQIASLVLRTYTGERLVLNFRAQLFRHVQRLSLAYHDTQGTADTVYRIQYDATAVQTIVIDGIIPFVTAGITVVGMLYVTAMINGQLALVALLIAPVLVLLTRVYRQPLRERWRRQKKLQSAAMSVVQEVLAALRVVKAFAQEDREHKRFARHSDESLAAHLGAIAFQGTFGLAAGLTITIGTGAVLFIGARGVQTGAMTLGELLIVMSYLGMLYAPLKTIGKKMAGLQNAFASAERAFALLDEKQNIVERPNARPISRAEGTVVFDNMAFGYEKDQPVLCDVSFKIPAGARVGIMGKTGAGKTTLVNLVTRLLDPDAGCVLLDGFDLREYKLNDLRNQFGIVLQEPVLFSTSIAENVAYARPEASDRDILEAAKAAGAHDFILRLPQGYETRVGERGMRLSGGERQRISLARAFLKDAPILILDEPTSSVDMKTEAAIMEAMERLMKGRTTFMIAHRLSTLEVCGILLKVEDGRVAFATGTTVASETRIGLTLDKAYG